MRYYLFMVAMVAGDRVTLLLERIGNLIRAQERRTGELVPVQLQALSYLANCNRYSDSPQAVTEYLGATKGTISQTLKRLREKGLVASKSDPDDGRRIHLRLTTKGRRVLRASSPDELIRESLQGVADSRALEQGLHELLRAMQRAQGGRAFGVCKTCDHFTPTRDGGQRCGLTGESLSTLDAEKLCREHRQAG